MKKNKAVFRMILISKKSVFIALFLAILTVFFSLGGALSSASAKRGGAEEVTVILDAGHGGTDGGVVGKSGVKESDINLEITKILQSELKSRGYKVVLTRSGKDSFSNIKKVDMQARKKVILEANADCLISIHINKFPNRTRRGAQVFYDDKGLGKSFATAMQSAINTYINKVYGNRSDYTAISGDFFITKCAQIPSIIIECGFISNVEDEKLLLREDYRRSMAKCIANSLDSLFQNRI